MAEQRSWSSMAAMLGVVGFIAAALWAKWNPASAQGQAAPPLQPKPAQTAAKSVAKGKTADATPNVKTEAKKFESNRAVPGAGQKLDSKALAKLIDDEIYRALRLEGIPPSGRSGDAEFLRRVYLDLIGVIPPPGKVTEFLDSKDPEKRAKVIDELLSNERFGKSIAEIWSGLMIPRESNNRRLDHAPFQNWLAKQFNDNVPLDKIVYSLLTSTGNLDENGAVGYFVGNPTVDKMTDNVSRMFLGVRLECAQCHNHPFVSWKQDDYWGMAAFFMKTKLTINPQQAAKKGVPPGVIETSGPAKGKKGNLPESAKIVPAKFLQGVQPKLPAGEPYRPVFAQWVVSPDNPFFARAMVNRFWYQLFGRGLVNPVDDMHEENLPSHPELLAALTEQFKVNGFDVKYLIRAICNSEAYQRTSRPLADNIEDKTLFSHRTVRVLSPEQLYDSIVAVMGQAPTKRGDVAPKQKGVPAGAREQFLNFFRVDDVDPQEYQSGIPQALRLMNSNQTNAVLAIADRAMTGSGGDPKKVIERLYLTIVSRPPGPEDQRRMEEFIRKAGGPSRQTYGDIAWALLNSSEFALNH
ncbi:MAG: DUF1549 and DUF1553 domain-containing protein [Gemmataceae bacterium]|nr:DUF1549 and DUF1553 domain-containing protein [Gemmataceae bacterium]